MRICVQPRCEYRHPHRHSLDGGDLINLSQQSHTDQAYLKFFMQLAGKRLLQIFPRLRLSAGKVEDARSGFLADYQQPPSLHDRRRDNP